MPFSFRNSSKSGSSAASSVILSRNSFSFSASDSLSSLDSERFSLLYLFKMSRISFGSLSRSSSALIPCASSHFLNSSSLSRLSRSAKAISLVLFCPSSLSRFSKPSKRSLTSLIDMPSITSSVIPSSFK